MPPTVTRVPSRLPIAVLTAALLGVMPSAAFPQTTVPAREGNIWGGLDHQPQQAQVARDEKATGVAASPVQREATARTVDELYRYLMARHVSARG